MAESVRWTELASAEFDQAAEYIAHDSPAYAQTFVEEVLAAVETLASWPESASIVPEFNDPEIREIFVNRYRIIYRVEPEGLCILAFVHSARDFSKAWGRRSTSPEDS